MARGCQLPAGVRASPASAWQLVALCIWRGHCAAALLLAVASHADCTPLDPRAPGSLGLTEEWQCPSCCPAPRCLPHLPPATPALPLPYAAAVAGGD